MDAINNNNMFNQVDETDLEDELDALRQEELDQKMLETGTVPVSDAINRLPAVGKTERKSFRTRVLNLRLTVCSERKGAGDRGGRRGSRTQEATSRDGHVSAESWRRSLCLGTDIGTGVMGLHCNLRFFRRRTFAGRLRNSTGDTKGDGAEGCAMDVIRLWIVT